MMISVIVPAYNASETIQACLEALQKQTVSCDAYEVIVVDDGSTDNTREIIAEHDVTLLCQERQRQAAARNAGIAIAQGEIICFTDADCAPAPNWLEELIKPFSQGDVIGCKGIYRTIQREYTARFVQIEYEDKYDLLCQQESIDFIDTYSAAYRREILLANDCFDASFPYLEDQELSFRLAARGYDMRFQPSAIVYHRHAHSPWDYFRKKFVIGFWKAQVVRRFPNRGVRDSHTPQVMKVQIGLMGLFGMALASLVGVWWLLPAFVNVIGWSVVIIATIFLVTTAPFVAKAWHKDGLVSLLSPCFLAIRALALGFGYGWGVIRPQSGISGRESTIGGGNYIVKRLLDIAGSMVGLLFTVICFPTIALAIKLSSSGPILFKQVRVGQGGRPFTIYKFRSMTVNAEEQLPALLDLDNLQEPVFKLEDDPRITKVGKFLRRWSLDELPQFWNVLKGEMSLIGPRPEEVQLVERYTDWHRRRLAVKPGMSGPMQVNGRGNLALDERVRLEIAYIEQYSLWQDILFILKTLPAVLRGDGAR